MSSFFQWLAGIPPLAQIPLILLAFAALVGIVLVFVEFAPRRGLRYTILRLAVCVVVPVVVLLAFGLYQSVIWVAAIAFLPLPTVLIVESSGSTSFSSGIYIGTILVTVVAIRIQSTIIERRGLREPDAPAIRTSWTNWLTVGLTAIALLIAVVFPVTSLFPLFLLLLARPISLLVHRGDADRRRLVRDA